MTRRRVLLAAATAAASIATLIGAPAAPASAHELLCADRNASGDTTPYYNQRFHAGPAISPTVLARWVPQGLTTWKNYYGKNHDLLVYTAYRELDGVGHAVIQGVDARDGSLTNYAVIGTGHVGGVAISGRWAFVSGPGSTVRRYALSNLADIFAGRTKDDTLSGGEAGPVYAASFLAADGDVLYAGRFSGSGDPGGAHRDKMYRYRVSASGTLSRIGGADDFIQVPAKTQGLLVLPSYFVYSTSEGRTNRSNIYVVKRGITYLDTADGSGSRNNLSCFRAPTMAEGLAYSQGRVYVAYESGASKYAGNEDGKGYPDRVITRLHWVNRADLPLLT